MPLTILNTLQQRGKRRAQPHAPHNAPASKHLTMPTTPVASMDIFLELSAPPLLPTKKLSRSASSPRELAFSSTVAPLAREVNSMLVELKKDGRIRQGQKMDNPPQVSNHVANQSALRTTSYQSLCL
jgi:hypothetical protein